MSGDTRHQTLTRLLLLLLLLLPLYLLLLLLLLLFLLILLQEDQTDSPCPGPNMNTNIENNQESWRWAELGRAGRCTTTCTCTAVHEGQQHQQHNYILPGGHNKTYPTCVRFFPEKKSFGQSRDKKFWHCSPEKKVFCFENNQFKHEETGGEYERKIQPGDVCVAP